MMSIKNKYNINIMKKLRNHLLLLILVIVLSFSCSKSNDLEKVKTLASENFVELSVIRDIANKINYPLNLDVVNHKNGGQFTKSVKEIKEIKNKSEKTSFYIVNYNQGGFIILSADKRTQPVLGYSVKNRFNIDEESYPPGLKFWMINANEQIEKLQSSLIEPTRDNKIAWDLVKEILINEVSVLKYEPIEDCYDHTEVYTVGPLMSTTWSQTGAFNDHLPFITCNGSGFQVYAGCVPIAMAQVMKYHEYPTSYSWSLMPNIYGTSTTASFISDIHDGIDNEYNNQPMYDCGATSVYSSKNMGTVLKNQFGYGSATKTNYDHSDVKSNIDNNKPVILSGSNSSSGHMWVCDGYRVYNFYYEDCSGYSYNHLKMNWGWGGSYDGWFSFDNFNPASTTYNDNKKMIYNITP